VDQKSEHLFFAIVPPGLERLALERLKKLLGAQLQAQCLPGGVEYRASFDSLHLINSQIKLATRILFRVPTKEGRYRDRPKLFKAISALSWRTFIPLDCPFHLKVSSVQSRLCHTEAIADTVNEAIIHSLKAQAPKKRIFATEGQTIYIRLENDQLFVSIDSTGLPLYQRRTNESGHRAALRSTLAFAMVELALELHRLIDPETDLELVDPMCGSGTLLQEALDYSAALNREFSFSSWSGLPPMIKTPSQNSANYQQEITLLASDLDLNYLPLDLKNQLTWCEQGDAFALPWPAPQLRRIVVSNPPYGERLSKKFKLPELIGLYRDKLKAHGLVIIGPRDWDLEGLVGKEKIIQKINLRNSGIATTVHSIRF
jgi:23S rRNA G2445 N2-methylase RlmL